MKGKLRLALCGLAIAALLLGASPALAVPVLPHAFYGTVTINGADAPVDSMVSAEVGGVDCGSYTIKVAGHYGSLDERDYLIVQGDISSGDTITFYVNGVSTDQTETFEAGGGPTEVNLIVTIPPTIGYSPSSFSFTATEGGADPSSQTLSISNTGVNPTAMDWSVTSDATWLSLSPTSGSSIGEVDSVTLSVSIYGMSAGSYPATVTTLALGATNTPQPVAVSLAIVAVAPAPPGPPGPPAPPPPGTTDVTGTVTTAGVFTEPVTATSEDELCTLTIPEGTVGLTEDLEPLDEITVVIMDEPPPPPEDAHVVGLAYDLGPDGATFDPPLTLTYTYDPAALPEGVAGLVLAYYDEETGEWVELPSTVDPVTHTITASVAHFTTFAIIGTVPPIPLPPAPAVFLVSNLTIQPAEVEPDEAVTIAVSVANTGGSEGSYTVVLKINGVKEAEKSVTIAAGGSQVVNFSVAKEAGSYTVATDGLSGSFSVVAPVVIVPEEEAPPEEEAVPEVPAKPEINWPVLGGVIAAVVVVGLLIFFLVRRRAY